MALLSENEGETVLEGVLEKRRANIHVWRPKRVVLKGSYLLMTTAETGPAHSSLRTPRGTKEAVNSVLLERGTRVEPSDQDQCSFDVFTPDKRSVHLRAKTPDEAMTWQEAILRVVNRKRTDIPPPPPPKGATSKQRAADRWKRVQSEMVRPQTPEQWVQALQVEPSVAILIALRERIGVADMFWMREFIDCQGIATLVDIIATLNRMASSTETGMANIVVQLQCLRCLSALLQNEAGLETLGDVSSTVTHLIASLDTSNILLRTHLFDILAALCVYNANSLQYAINALEAYKLGEDGSLFDLIVTSLESEEEEDYKVACLTFINAVVNASENLDTRVRVRLQFVRRGLLRFLKSFRESEVYPLRVQAFVFEEEMNDDETEFTGVLLTARENIESKEEAARVADTVKAFNMLLDKLKGTRIQRPFANILKDLARMPVDRSGMDVWGFVQQVVEKALELRTVEPREVSTVMGHLIPSTGYRTPRSERTRPSRSAPAGEETTQEETKKAEDSTTTAPETPAPPPPPPPPPGGPPAPPPPPPGPPGAPPPPPIPGVRIPAPEGHPPKETVIPKRKMKQFNWSKVPVAKIAHTFFSRHSDEDIDLDTDQFEDLFSVPEPSAAGLRMGAVRLPLTKIQAVTLLDMNRANNIAILLSRLRLSNDEIRKAILTLDHNTLSVQEIKNFLNHMPTAEEREMLEQYEGDRDQLGKAEQFFLMLLTIPRLEARLRSFLYKQTFDEKMGEVRPETEALFDACTELRTSEGFADVLKHVLRYGNYLNGGTLRGGAYGFKIDALNKLEDVKSADRKSTLLHFLAAQLSKKHAESGRIPFLEELLSVEKASKVSLTALQGTLSELKKGLEQVKREVIASGGAEEVAYNYKLADFVERAEEELTLVSEKATSLDEKLTFIAEYFGEDAQTFNSEDFYGRLHNFHVAFARAIRDNERMEQAKKRAALASTALEKTREQRAMEGARKRLEDARDKVAEGSSKYGIMPGKAASAQKGVVDALISMLGSGRVFKKQREARNSIRMNTDPGLASLAHVSDVSETAGHVDSLRLLRGVHA